MIQRLRDFFRLEAASAILLLLVALAAMVMANSSWVNIYQELWTPSLLHLINDGLMAIFFLLIGIEIRHEMTAGELAGKSKAMLPVLAALGGMIVPALIYSFFNSGTPQMRGWAIPSATDIAFSLGVLALFGSRIPSALRVFLMAVAVIDDLGAVVIIALFYTRELALPALVAAFACAGVLYAFSLFRIRPFWPYLFAGLILWAFMLHSGVHATIAGVMFGLLLPARHGRFLSDRLHPWVAFGIMPLFAFANAGVPLGGLTAGQLLDPLPLGIALGLFAGKQAGIFATCWLLVRLKLASLPAQAGWLEFYAVCMLAGIGFTMSLFIGTLAFEDGALQMATRLGVIMGSLLSALGGALLLWVALRGKRAHAA